MRRSRRSASGISRCSARARGDDTQDSDVDLLLDIAERSSFSLLDLVGVEQFVSDTTGLQANAFLARSLDEPFRRTIEPDTIQVF